MCKKKRKEPVKKKFIQQIIDKGPHYRYVADLWQPSQEDIDILGGIKYFYEIIDHFSKFLWIEPLKNKDAETILNCFKKYIMINRKCKIYQTDRGT